MGFALGPVAGMARMQVRFVRHVEAIGRESLSQLLCDVIFYAHGGGIRFQWDIVNRQDRHSGPRRHHEKG
jgi:hypothetical protein